MRNEHLLNGKPRGNDPSLRKWNRDPMMPPHQHAASEPEKLSLFAKVRRSLHRDRELPFRQKFYKALVYIESMVLAHLVLFRCSKVGRRPRTRGRPHIVNYGNIEIGDDFNLSSRIVRSELATGHKGTIEIGDEVSINFGALISSQRLVKIGNRVRIGPYAVITDSDFHTPLQRFTLPEGIPTIIEDEVWLGVRVTVLKGSRIGRGAVISAGSVVSGTIPPYVLAGGVPARVIKRLRHESSDEKEQSHTKTQEEDTNEVRQKVITTFLQTFGSTGALDLSMGPGAVPSWDSLGHLNFIVALEAEFGIVFSDEDMMRMNSLSEICELITRTLEAHITARTV